MRLFLSYANEHRAEADAITLRLREAGHQVFFDKDDLPPGESYDDRIRRALSDADGLIFLVSPESVAPGRYTLTEMGFARERWPNPSRRVLPVMVAATPYKDVPEYLKAVTVLEPQGNVVAETVARAESLGGGLRVPRWAVAAAVLAVTIAGGLFAWHALGPGPKPTERSRGTVSDLATEAPVGGAAVQIRCGTGALAEGVTDQGGRFDLAFVPCKDGDAAISVKHSEYTEQARPVPADGKDVALALLPKGLGGCVLKSAQGVVVGHFRPPLSGSNAGSDLAGRIADALTYDVLVVIQTLNLPATVQPRFVACDEARPRSVDFATGYARALGADAFVMGNVEPADGAYKVTAFVGDAFQLFRPPVPATNAGVTLDDPAAARMAPDMRGALLTALARGYAERQMFRECVDVAVAAQHLVGRRTPALEQTLTRCQDGTGLAGLRTGG
jgi:hypothetical protein